MRIVRVIGVLAGMLVGGTALAQEAASGMMPKPAAELQQLKGLIGNWKCDGKMGMNGHEMSAKSTYKVAWELDNFWLVAHLEGAKSKEMPTGFRGVDYYNYEPAAKQFVMMSFDNAGGWSMMTSKGWDGDKMAWVGRAEMMGAEFESKLTVTRKGENEHEITGTTIGPGMTETVTLSCKK